MVQEKLKSIRKQKNLSQEQMAKILSTDTSNYSRKERGEVKINDKEWEKLAQALDVPLESIKEVVTNGHSFQYDNSNLHDNSGSNINYYSIPDSIIKNMQDYIELLKESTCTLKTENQELKEQLQNKNS